MYRARQLATIEGCQYCFIFLGLSFLVGKSEVQVVMCLHDAVVALRTPTDGN